MAIVLMGKEAGLGLGEMRALLSAGNPMDHVDLLGAYIVVLECRIVQAQAAKDRVERPSPGPVDFDECTRVRARIEACIPT